MQIISIVMLAAWGPWPPAQSGTQAASARPAFQAMLKEAKAHIREMDIKQLKALESSGEPFILIDVREDNEWAASHAKGAVHIGKGVLDRDIEPRVPDKTVKIVLYCHSGVRSALAADMLMKMGYSNVYSVAGGITAYKAAGLPME